MGLFDISHTKYKKVHTDENTNNRQSQQIVYTYTYKYIYIYIYNPVNGHSFKVTNPVLEN